MAKKSVDAELAAYKSKGMKAPRPDRHPSDPRSVAEAPKAQPSMQHIEPAHEMNPDSVRMPPDHKKKALPSKDAPAGASPGANMGDKMDVNEHYHNPLSDKK